MSEEPSDEVLDERRGRVLHLTINRPQRRNALNPHVISALREKLREAEADAEVRAVVVEGSGDRAFCAGGDLMGMSDASRVEQHFERAALGELLKEIRGTRLPVVAAVNGDALGGGFGLMLACDLVVAVEDARFGTPEINLGLWPFVITAAIQRDVPRKLALELMMTGRKLDAHEARARGLLNRVVPRTELAPAVDQLTQELLSKSPLILGLGKRSFYRAEDMTFDAAVAYLAGMLTLCLESEDTVEGVSAFLQKRAPEWKGR